MTEFFNVTFAYPTVVFTGLLALSFLYWLLVIIGALGESDAFVGSRLVWLPRAKHTITVKATDDTSGFFTVAGLDRWQPAANGLGGRLISGLRSFPAEQSKLYAFGPWDGVHVVGDGEEGWSRLEGLPSRAVSDLRGGTDPHAGSFLYAALPEGVWRGPDDGSIGWECLTPLPATAIGISPVFPDDRTLAAVVEDGRVVEYGTHAELLAAGEEFIHHALKAQDTMAVCQPRITQHAIRYGMEHLDQWVAGNRLMMEQRHELFREEFTRPGNPFALVTSPLPATPGTPPARRAGVISGLHVTCVSACANIGINCFRARRDWRRGKSLPRPPGRPAPASRTPGNRR